MVGIAEAMTAGEAITEGTGEATGTIDIAGITGVTGTMDIADATGITGKLQPLTTQANFWTNYT